MEDDHHRLCGNARVARSRSHGKKFTYYCSEKEPKNPSRKKRLMNSQTKRVRFHLLRVFYSGKNDAIQFASIRSSFYIFPSLVIDRTDGI